MKLSSPFSSLVILLALGAGAQERFIEPIRAGLDDPFSVEVTGTSGDGPVKGPDGKMYPGPHTSKVKVNIQFVPTGHGWADAAVHCVPTCSPLKTTHKDCPEGCDSPCGRTHSFEVPGYNKLKYGMNGIAATLGAYDALAALSAKTGVALPPRDRTGTAYADALDYIDDFAEDDYFFSTDPRGDEEGRPDFIIGHRVGGAPCTAYRRLFGSLEYKTMVSYTLSVYSATTGVIMMEATTAPVDLGEVWLPSAAPFAEDTRVMCNCGPDDTSNIGAPVGMAGYGLMPGIGIGARYDPALIGFPIGMGAGGIAGWGMIGKGYEDFGMRGISIETEVISMNEGTVTVTSTRTGSIAVHLPGGTILLPNDPEMQAVFIIDDVVIPIPGMGTECSRPVKVSVPVKVRCAEFNKKEPRAGIKYFIVAPKDERYYSIAKQLAKSRLRGPWTQAQLWAYTDSADLATINDRLVPTVKKWQYLEGLWQLARSGASITRRKAAARILAPDLLTEPSRPEATSWFVHNLARVNPKELARFLDGAKDIATTMLTSADDLKFKHAAAMLRAATGAKDSGVAVSALKLCSGLSGSAWESLEKSGGVGIQSRLFSRDEKVALAALEVTEKQGIKALAPLVKALSEAPGSSKVKQTAAKLIAKP